MFVVAVPALAVAVSRGRHGSFAAVVVSLGAIMHLTSGVNVDRLVLRLRRR